MRYGDPISDVTKAISLFTRDRAVRSKDLNVYIFPQIWSSTSLGYGDIGGQTMTSAHTVVVSDGVRFEVSFGGGEVAYAVSRSEIDRSARVPTDWFAAFMGDLHAHTLVAKRDAAQHYGKALIRK